MAIWWADLVCRGCVGGCIESKQQHGAAFPQGGRRRRRRKSRRKKKRKGRKSRKDANLAKENLKREERSARVERDADNYLFFKKDLKLCYGENC